MARPMVNAVFLVGNLGKLAKRMATKGGKPYAFFTLAINRDWYSGQKESITDWIDCVTYSPKVVDLVTDERAKGRTCMISGNLQTYSTSKNGESVKRTQVVAKYVHITPPIDEMVAVEVESGREEPSGEGEEEDVPF